MIYRNANVEIEEKQNVGTHENRKIISEVNKPGCGGRDLSMSRSINARVVIVINRKIHFRARIPIIHKY